jgi:hypothetical protein
LVKENLAAGNKDFLFPEFVLRHQDIFELGEGFIMDLKIEGVELGIEALVNRHGLVLVGSELRQYEQNSIKIVSDYTPGKEYLLDRDTPDYQAGLQIIAVEKRHINTVGDVAGFDMGEGNVTCQGYVGGNTGADEKVIGDAYVVSRIVYDYLRGTGWQAQVHMYVKATNRNKTLIGTWQNKRTAQLRIDSTGPVSYSVPFWGVYGQRDLYQTTNGELMSSITAGVYLSPWVSLGNTGIAPNPGMQGVVRVYGRNGSTCPL